MRNPSVFPSRLIMPIVVFLNHFWINLPDNPVAAHCPGPHHIVNDPQFLSLWLETGVSLRLSEPESSSSAGSLSSLGRLSITLSRCSELKSRQILVYRSVYPWQLAGFLAGWKTLRCGSERHCSSPCELAECPCI